MNDHDGMSDRVANYHAGDGDESNERVAELAKENGVTMAQVALAWLLHQEAVDAPVVGTTSVDHLEDAVAALEIDRSGSDQAYLEAPYEPVPVDGHE
jgi:aryl-alcohol dehydrogenase-like predicted oxidoreductase